MYTAAVEKLHNCPKTWFSHPSFILSSIHKRVGSWHSKKPCMKNGLLISKGAAWQQKIWYKHNAFLQLWAGGREDTVQSSKGEYRDKTKTKPQRCIEDTCKERVWHAEEKGAQQWWLQLCKGEDFVCMRGQKESSLLIELLTPLVMRPSPMINWSKFEKQSMPKQWRLMPRVPFADVVGQ